MNKKVVKVLTMVIMIVMIMSITVSSLAIEPGDIKGTQNPTGSPEIATVGQNIVGILQTFGIVLSVVVLVIIGIKYMMGSAEEKADYKKTMIPYIAGAAVIFMASVLAQVIYKFFTGITI